MRIIIAIRICIVISLTVQAQSPIGAWEGYSMAKNGEKLKYVVIFSDRYQVLTTYNTKNGKFVHSNGGSWELQGDSLTERVEFHTDNPGMVGQEFRFKVSISDSTLQIVDSEMRLKRIDDGLPGQLKGAWLMSGRIKNGETQLRDSDAPRKTMKILSGTRFQWIAYNTETKEFKGTGGGTYTTTNGNYKENIEFFSKDDSKVGLSLEFNYELIDGKWHHTGLSSKGDPIHEIWSKRK